jgi:hypothetical protein
MGDIYFEIVSPTVFGKSVKDLSSWFVISSYCICKKQFYHPIQNIFHQSKSDSNIAKIFDDCSLIYVSWIYDFW